MRDRGAPIPIKRLVAPLAIALFFAFIFVAPFGFVWPCPVRVAFHVPCPTCGMTRAARFVAHGEFAEATRVHPLWFIVLPLFGAIVALEIVQYVRTGRWGGSARIPALRWIGLFTAIVLIAVWIARFFGAFGGPAPI